MENEKKQGFTPGPWHYRHRYNEGGPLNLPVDAFAITADRGNMTIAETLFSCNEDEANARLIVAAVNSCFQINPLNPLAVAEALPELVEATQSVMIKLCDLMNPGLDRPRPDLEEMHDGLAAALAKIGAKGK